MIGYPSSWKTGGGKAADGDYKKPLQPVLSIMDRDRGQAEDAPWHPKKPTEYCREWAAGRCVRNGDCPDNRWHKFPPGAPKSKSAGKAAKSSS